MNVFTRHKRDDASGDDVVARPIGLRAVVLRVRAVVVAREVALQGKERSGCFGVIVPMASDGVASRGPKSLGTKYNGTPPCGPAVCAVALVPESRRDPTATMLGDTPADERSSVRG